jgi:hypothetical protein
MSKNRSLTVAIALMGQVLAACGSDSNGGPAPNDAGGPSGPGTVYGIVTDIGTGAGVAGAVVSGGGQTTTTDSHGGFTLAGLVQGSVNLAVDGKDYAPAFTTTKISDTTQPAFITVKKQGQPQSYNRQSSMTLSQKTEAGPYAVILQPDSLETGDSTLQVSITPLDPTKEREALPGSLVSGGVMSSLLVPVTFAEFSILDAAGKRVNLKAAANAQVELPIPPSLRPSYPMGAKIHCYSFDPSTAKWEDFVEGTVQVSSVDKSTPVLAASVRHFSWYGGAPQGNNCVDVYVNVVSAVDGKPLPNARVEASPGTVAYTDASGTALVRSAVGTMGSTYTAYQTGIDVDGTLTGTKGAKYIEFGKVEEDLVGLVQKPCTGDPGPTPGQAAVRGSQQMPLTLKIGRVTGALYEATAILSAGDTDQSGQVQVILEQGPPGPDGKIVDGMAASGAKITVTEGGGMPMMLAELAPGTGVYAVTAGLKITAGKSYLISIDADGNGSIDGTGSVFALGKLAWTNPTEGATVASAGLVARWSDTGSELGGAAYAPLYYVNITNMTANDGALYIGTDRQFTAQSIINPMVGLSPGMYTGTVIGFSGPFATSTGLGTSNNITGAGVTGVFYSVSSSSNGQDTITFTVQ